jgi:hypothetical protein
MDHIRYTLHFLVCLQPPEQFFSFLSAVTITRDMVANLEVFSARMAFILRAIPTTTRDLGLHGLIRMTSPNVQTHDVRIAAAQTTALRRPPHSIFLNERRT